MQLNDIITINDYQNAWQYALENNYTIVEIERINGNRQFKIVEKQRNVQYEMETEMGNLKYWFDNDYAQKEQKFRRLHTLYQLELNKSTDAQNAYSELIKLYNEAELKRQRIQELEVLINEVSR